jgi:CubicO group peptidase (beta-lactamase class C family)
MDGASPTGVVDRLASRLERVAAPAAAAALVAQEGPVWSGATGTARPSDGQGADPRTAFLWFSMTKIATATAVMQLVDAGDVALDDPAREHLPELEGLDRRITVRHLLSHSSGLGNPLPLRWIHPAGEPGPDPREMVSRLLGRHGRLRFDPGERGSYSNIGYLVLGELISEVSGTPYRAYVRDRVLEPLGAESTGFTFDSAGAAHRSEGAHPRRDPALVLLRLLIPRWAFGPAVGRWRLFAPFYLDGAAYGGLIGPVGDAALLAAAHLADGAVAGNRILTAESTAEMRRVAARGRKFEFALGWRRSRRDAERGETYLEHPGGGGGYGTAMRLYPDRGLAVVAMANVSLQAFSYEDLVRL